MDKKEPAAVKREVDLSKEFFKGGICSASLVPERYIPALMGQAAEVPHDAIGPMTWKDYLATEKKKGSQVEMLVEQASLAHIVSIRLLSVISKTKSPQELEIYTNCAVGLMAEVRRTSEAIMRMRNPPSSSKINIAKTEVHINGNGDGKTADDIQETTRDTRESVNNMAKQACFRRLHGEEDGRPAKPEATRTAY